ncbi:MAG: hypothetical protein M3Y60_14680, partial [Bacteroidota bacterium]|nr:hypothetical protein [Bacteroidota bacterium]
MKRLLRSILQSAIALNVFIAVAAHAQPTVVADIPDNSTNFVEMGDLVYFTAGEALWRTDGTGGGTIQLRPSGFTQENQWQYAPYGREFDGLFYFVNANSTELWRSDGSAEGTVLLKTFSMQSVRILDTTDSYLFFVASDAATGEEVYRTDGTVSGTILLKDVYPGSTSGYRGVSGALDNQFFFAGDDGVSGTELWKSDGTPAGTVMVEDIYPGVGNGVAPGSNAYSFDGQFYFRGNTPLNGMEPWVSDGTTAGTRILHDINPGPENSGPTRFAIDNNGFLYFLILNDYDEGPAVLWKTAETTASTSQVAIVGQEGSQNSFHSFLVYRGKVYFWDRTDYFADNLWVT